MNCEQVKELVSAYLDNALAPEEYDTVTAHLHSCQDCHQILADFRHFDALLFQLPRVSPDPALRERIFSSPEYLELTSTGTFGSSNRNADRTTRRSRELNPNRPRLVALRGGRQPFSGALAAAATHTPRPDAYSRHWHLAQSIPFIRFIIAATLLLIICLGSLISWNVWKQQVGIAQGIKGGITPPAALPQGPLPAGLRFIFLRTGALWSAPTDGGTGIVRLTPENVVVATNWAVRPELPGRPAGNMLAYIDLQQGRVHIIRSDGQRDIALAQPLLKPGIPPATVWDTNTGAAILNGLAWSKDGSMLAFIADPRGTNLPRLYIYSVSTGDIQQVQLPLTGAVSHPVWSPDGVRIAFVFTSDGNVGIQDYNTQNHGILSIASALNTRANPNDGVLTLEWSPNADAPTLTWSVGVVGHVHSIWLQRVGVEGTANARLLTRGDYVQATYSRTGQNKTGGWLLVTSLAGLPGDILSMNLNAEITRLTFGKQVSFVQWSPDGVRVDYFDALSAGTGNLHAVHTTTRIDTLIADGAAKDPLPAWSSDGQQLAYSTGTHVLVVDVQTIKTSEPLKIQGSATALSWSASSPKQLVIAVDDGQPGLYLADTQQDTTLQLDKEGTRGPILWTQIP